MKEHVFRRYDIRGEVGIDFSIEEIATFIDAFSAYIHARYPASCNVAVGRDGRTHSEAIHEQVCIAFRRSGFTVFDLGVCPTPIVHFALQSEAIDIGCMITASHNGPTYNGLKLMHKDRSIWGDELQEIATWYRMKKSVRASVCGDLYDYGFVKQRYIEWLAQHFSSLIGLQKRLIFDCGSGATGIIMPELIARMQWDARILYGEIDGTFPHHEADPTVASNMCDLAVQVVTQHYAIGIGFDGDGDRMGVISESGALLTGDQLILLFARFILKHTGNAGIVYDAKCSQTVARMVNEWGGVAHRSASGYANIRNVMGTTQALLGGELSCHFFFADRYFGYDDGIYAALRFIELMMAEERSVDDILTLLPRLYITSEWRMPFVEEHKIQFMSTIYKKLRHHPVITEMDLLDGIRASTVDGWLLIRASHTQPVICIRCEAATAEGLSRLAPLMIELLEGYVNEDTFLREAAQWLGAAQDIKQNNILRDIT